MSQNRVVVEKLEYSRLGARVSAAYLLGVCMFVNISTPHCNLQYGFASSFPPCVFFAIVCYSVVIISIMMRVVSRLFPALTWYQGMDHLDADNLHCDFLLICSSVAILIDLASAATSVP